VTAPTLISDAALRWLLAGPVGVPLADPDPRLPALYAAGRIEPRGEVWRWNVRIPSQVGREQREAIREDQRYVRREDS
jgi:hypothetical protein